MPSFTSHQPIPPVSTEAKHGYLQIPHEIKCCSRALRINSDLLRDFYLRLELKSKKLDGRRFHMKQNLITQFIWIGCAATMMAQNPVNDWNAIAITETAQLPPHLQSRTLAILNLSMHDAIQAVQGNYARYRPGNTTPGVQVEIAAASAARVALLGTLPPTAADAIEALYNQALASSLDAAGSAVAISTGQLAAKQVLAGRADDMAKIDGSIDPALAAHLGAYQPFAPAFSMKGAFPGWGRLTPFTMVTSGQFRPGPPPAVNSADFAFDVNETKNFGGAVSATRTATQGDIAKFWYESSVFAWHRIAVAAAEARGMNLGDKVRLLAMLHAGLADSYIAMSDAKYAYYKCRPVTAIKLNLTKSPVVTPPEGEPVLDWVSFLETPPDPEYPSGDAQAGAVAAEILALLLGTDYVQFSLTSGAPYGGIKREFVSFSSAAAENAMSRVFAGLHFPSSTQAGLIVGRSIGRQAARTMLLPVKK